MLLNVTIFIWIGAVCPWDKFAYSGVIPLYRLIPLGIMVLLFRRPPIVLLLHNKIHQIEHMRQAAFTGFFGPIGVSAVFYLFLTVEWLEKNIRYEDHEREDADRLSQIVQVVVWFLVICSIFIHGLTIPAGKLGIYLPRTLSRSRSEAMEPETPPHPSALGSAIHPPGISPPKPIWKLGTRLFPGGARNGKTSVYARGNHDAEAGRSYGNSTVVSDEPFFASRVVNFPDGTTERQREDGGAVRERDS